MNRPLLNLFLITGLLTLPVSAQLLNKSGDISEAVVKKVDPSVVAIHHERATGSGFIISKDGYILSNGHVTAGSNEDDPTEPAKAITVVLNDETKYSARVLGFSLNPDVALLKIEPRGELVPVEYADVHLAQIGQPCFAVGTPHGLKRTFSRGILSNVDRTDLGTFTKVFQTDAAINPGNSGGPLFDSDGRVLGLNTYASRGANNLGFTIPINYALVMKDHFLKHGRFVRTDLPTFFAEELYDEMQQALGIENGLLIHYVNEGSLADQAGLRTGDVIIEIDGSPVSAHNRAQMLDINWDITVRKPDSPIVFTVLRGAPGKTTRVEIKTKLVEAEPLLSTRQFKGEIITSRIDALGLAYKPVVTMHRLSYNLTDAVGALVSTSDPSSAAERAGLASADIITAVEGTPVNTPEALEAALLVHLRAGLKAIDLTVNRRSYTFSTALKPYYNLKDQRVLVILPSGIPEQLDRIVRELAADGAKVTLYSIDGGTAVSIPEGLQAPLPLEQINLEGMDRLLFVDGEGAETLHENAAVLTLVKDAFEAKKFIAAEGAAALVIPAASEKLHEKKMTTRRELSTKATELQGQYTGQDVEADGRILTSAGDGEETTRAFLKKFRSMR
jgi:serine protease Do